MLLLFWILLMVMGGAALVVLLYVTSLASKISRQRSTNHIDTVSSTVVWPIWAAVASIPLLALGLYLHLGASSELKSWFDIQRDTAFISDLTAQYNNQTIENTQVQMALETYLDEHQQSVSAWVLLGRFYLDSQHYNRAVTAFSQANALKPDDLDILAGLVHAQYFAQEGMIVPKTAALIDRILQQSPQYPSIVNLVASDAMRRGDFARALSEWGSIINAYPEDSDNYQIILAAMARAREQLLSSLDATIETEKNNSEEVLVEN